MSYDATGWLSDQHRLQRAVFGQAGFDIHDTSRGHGPKSGSLWAYQPSAHPASTNIVRLHRLVSLYLGSVSLWLKYYPVILEDDCNIDTA